MIPFNLIRDFLEEPGEHIEDRFDSGPPGLFRVEQNIRETVGLVWLDYIFLFLMVFAAVAGLFLLVLWR